MWFKCRHWGFCTDRLLCMCACYVWGCVWAFLFSVSQQAWEHVLRTRRGLYVEV